MAMSPFFLLPNTYGLRVKMIVNMVLLMVKATSDYLCCVERVHRMRAQLFNRLLQ
jgi:hypothetical protein